LKGGEKMDIIIKDETLGQSWGYVATKTGYAEALARARSILAAGHKLGGNRTIADLEYALR